MTAWGPVEFAVSAARWCDSCDEPVCAAGTAAWLPVLDMVTCLACAAVAASMYREAE